MNRSPSIDFSDVRRIAITAVFSDDFLFERVVLKGGNALAIVLAMGARTSLDLDFSIESDFEDLADVALRLEKALQNRFEAAGVIVFDFKFERRPSTERAGQDQRWGGYVASFKLADSARHKELAGDLPALQREATLVGPGQQRVFTIDFSKYEYTKGKLATDLDHYRIFVYTPEMIAIEKLRAICQQMPEYTLNRTPCPRARDFFDIHLILTTTDVDLCSSTNLQITRDIFAAKDVPLYLLQFIEPQREFHRPDWDSVRISTKQPLQDFDFYFDFVLKEVLSLQALWNE
jgi:hypothetical protein